MRLSIADLNVKIFADGANIAEMIEMASKTYISGLTTNPTLMRKAGVVDYVKFAKDVLKEIQDKPISFEVFSDNLDEMKTQAETIASWGDNVYVKIPITNTAGIATYPVIEHLSRNGIKVNVTAVMTHEQVEQVSMALNSNVESYVSVFAGRIADTGRDPIPTIKKSIELLSDNHKSELIWASPRELLNVIQANDVGCDVITATKDILNKLNLIGYNLNDYSLDTVKMFKSDADASNFKL